MYVIPALLHYPKVSSEASPANHALGDQKVVTQTRTGSGGTSWQEIGTDETLKACAGCRVKLRDQIANWVTDFDNKSTQGADHNVAILAVEGQESRLHGPQSTEEC